MMDQEQRRANKKAQTDGPEAGEGTVCSSHQAHEEQEYMGDGDSVDRSQGWGWTRSQRGMHEGLLASLVLKTRYG